MEISEFTLRLILLFTPGIISLLIIEAISTHGKWEFYRIVLYSLILGFLDYLLYSLISQIDCLGLNKLAFFEALVDTEKKIDLKEVLRVSFIIAPVLGVLLTYIFEKKLVHRFVRKIRISKKMGDIDIWSYVYNMETTQWVIIRDFNHDLMFEGKIQAFSDAAENDELFLTDVKVYKNSTAEYIYETPGMYLSPERDKYIFEFPQLYYEKNKKP